MIAFWLFSALLAALTLVFVLQPLVQRGKQGADASRDALNLSVYREQLHELDAELDSGALAREEHARARRELERRLLDDVGELSVTAPAPGIGLGPVAGLAIAVALLALLVYLSVGNPAAVVPG
jgi:cytochrome c-type biogenesis protein CcmH